MTSMGEIMIDQNFWDHLDDTELEFAEFYKENETLLGFLLYIGEEEFKETYERIQDHSDHLASQYTAIICNHKDMLSKKFFESTYKKVLNYFTIASLIYKKRINYSPGKEDDDWLLEPVIQKYLD